MMNPKSALIMMLLVNALDCETEPPNSYRSISTMSIETLNKTFIKNRNEIENASFKILHKQTRNDTIFGNEIADSLAQRSTRYGGGSHYCYQAGKKPTSDIMDIQLTGISAYMAADQHANAVDYTSGWPYYVELTDPKNPVFKDNEVVLSIKGLNRLFIEQPWNYDVKKELKKALQEGLPKGVVMVWNRLKPGNGKNWVNNGHFAITIGNGKERSWKTMNIVVFPTELRLFIPNHISHEHNPDSTDNRIAEDIIKLAQKREADIDNVRVKSLFAMN
jgi:hypothetical protein